MKCGLSERGEIRKCFKVSEKEVGGTLIPRDHRREVRIFASEHLFKSERECFGDLHCSEIVVALQYVLICHLDKIRMNSEGREALTRSWLKG